MRKDVAHLATKVFDVGVVYYSIIGAIPLKVQRLLRFLQPLQILGRPRPVAHNSGQTQLPRCLYKYDPIALLRKPRLKQERRIPYDRFDGGVRRILLHQ